MIIANNKKAFFDYFIEEKYEAGIELKGSEVKSIKAGKVSIKESFVRIINDEIFIMGMSVVPWDVHLSKGYVKIQIAIAKGKKNYDKRESIAKKDQERNLKREFKSNNR